MRGHGQPSLPSQPRPNAAVALSLHTQMCNTNHWGFLRLDGSASVKQRQPLVDQFNSPQHPSFVLLLSSKAGGVGCAGPVSCCASSAQAAMHQPTTYFSVGAT